MMSVYRSSTPITTFYGSDYRPDDEPSSEAVLEEKRILDHQLRRPSPSRRTPSTMSAIRPPSTTRPGTSQSLRVRTSGSSPRRSLQRSTAFRSKRSITITDRGRTASMPAVPVIKVSKLSSLSLWKCIIVVFWITVILYMDPDPVVLYRIKTKNEHDPGVRKATVISIIMKYLKALVMAVHAYKSTEIKTIVNDIRSAEQRLNCKASAGFITCTVSCVGLLTTLFELLFDYPWSSLANHRLIYIEGISRICLLTIDVQFCNLCVRLGRMYNKLDVSLKLVNRSSNLTNRRQCIAGLPYTRAEFSSLSAITANMDRSFSVQLFLAVGLHFAAVLVSVYLFVFHTFALGVPWTKTVTLRFLNNLWRLSIISGAAHYAVGQALRVYRKLGQMRTSCLETEDIEEIEMYFIQYDPENVSFKLFGSLTLDWSLMILFFDSVFRCSLILIQYNWMDNAFKVN